MKTTMKRLASLAMTGALALSISAPAFAATPTVPTVAKGNTTKITSTYQKTDIEVLVPGAVTGVIDPYGIGFTLKDSNNAAKTFKGQIVTPPMAIYNKTALDLDVNASVIGAATGTSTLKLATATTKAQGTEGQDGYVPAATTKSAFVQIQFAESAATGATEAAVADTILNECSTDSTWASATPITVGTKASTPEKVVTLKKATMDSDGAFASYGAKSIAVFRLTGDCAEDPKEAWAETDGFEANITFTFKPAAATTP